MNTTQEGLTGGVYPVTEIVMALATIAVPAPRPGGLSATHEIGALPSRFARNKEDG